MASKWSIEKPDFSKQLENMDFAPEDVQKTVFSREAYLEH